MAYKVFQLPFRLIGDESDLVRTQKNFEYLADAISRLQLYENSTGIPLNNIVDANNTEWNAVATNFNNRNDRIATVPANPTIAADGTAVDHAMNTDGSADISFEWSFTGTGDAYDIDGFIVFVRSSTSNTSYTFGTTPAEEILYYVTSEKRAFILYGVAANLYYTFGIQAYRMVDQDIHADGILKSSIIKPSLVTENPYQPSSSISFAGNVTGTVAGVAADSISKTPATVIVADGSTTQNTKRADYVVPAGSTSAQTTINNAINSLPAGGGKVMLLDGTFIRDGSIVLKSGVSLDGQGDSTIIKTKDNLNIDDNAITNSDWTNGNNNIAISNLLIDGNKANQTVAWQNGIYFYNVSHSKCIGVQIKNIQTRGLNVEYSSNNIFSCNILKDCGEYGISIGVSSNYNAISGNICNNNYNAGIDITTGTNNAIVGNTCQNNGGNGIELSAGYNTISGNTCQRNGYTGIYLFSASNNNINSNICTENSQAANNVGNNITLDINSDYNSVQNNTCRKGTLTNKPCYGIRINSSDCNGNIVTNNDLYDSGVTASFSDAGTGTITTAGNRL